MTSWGSVSGPSAVSEHAKSRMMQRRISWDVLSLVYECKFARNSDPLRGGFRVQ